MGGVAGYWYVGGMVVAGLLLGISLRAATTRRTPRALPAGLTAVPPVFAPHAVAAPMARAAATLAAPAWAPASTAPGAWLPEAVSPPTWRPADYPR
jgi:hypothetical protein